MCNTNNVAHNYNIVVIFFFLGQLHLSLTYVQPVSSFYQDFSSPDLHINCSMEQLHYRFSPSCTFLWLMCNVVCTVFVRVSFFKFVCNPRNVSQSSNYFILVSVAFFYEICACATAIKFLSENNIEWSNLHGLHTLVKIVWNPKFLYFCTDVLIAYFYQIRATGIKFSSLFVEWISENFLNFLACNFLWITCNRYVHINCTFS
jgi:hypothetical protein